MVDHRIGWSCFINIVRLLANNALRDVSRIYLYGI